MSQALHAAQRQRDEDAMTYVKRSICAEAKKIRRSPSMARAWWSATALSHMAADETCERAWSCTCGACCAAREKLGLPVPAARRRR
jgi:hypothetical protein